jgi:hypothetical protein
MGDVLCPEATINWMTNGGRRRLGTDSNTIVIEVRFSPGTGLLVRAFATDR